MRQKYINAFIMASDCRKYPGIEEFVFKLSLETKDFDRNIEKNEQIDR